MCAWCTAFSITGFQDLNCLLGVNWHFYGINVIMPTSPSSTRNFAGFPGSDKFGNLSEDRVRIADDKMH